MRILVPVKRVVDPYAKVKPLADGSGIDTGGLKFEINPFDEIAVEEASRHAVLCKIVCYSYKANLGICSSRYSASNRSLEFRKTLRK